MPEVGPRITIDDPTLAASLARSGLGTAPIGHLLRESAPDRWIRFHFFRTYRRPKMAEDEAAIMSMFTTLGSRLFEPEEPLKVCIWTHWEDDLAQDHYRCLTRKAFWSPSGWRERLLDVASFGLESFTLLSLEADAGISVYDGGFDVFARDRTERDILRADFAEWLSERSDGL